MVASCDSSKNGPVARYIYFGIRKINLQQTHFNTSNSVKTSYQFHQSRTVIPQVKHVNTKVKKCTSWTCRRLTRLNHTWFTAHNSRPEPLNYTTQIKHMGTITYHYILFKVLKTEINATADHFAGLIFVLIQLA